MEYIKLKNALHILDNVMSDEGIKHKGKAIRKRLKELPEEDVVEVVRCVECKYIENISCPITGMKQYCCDYGIRPILVEADHFCSYGERKEGAR